MTKEQAINKINNTPHIYLNNDQKRIAVGIINSIPNNQDVLAYFDFIMKRADVGFKFDLAPEIAIGRIAVVNEIESYNINVNYESVDVSENKLIIGDNYEALKNLLLTHKNKVDIIYIDPPYNTEKSHEDGNTSAKEGGSSKFIYKDKFGRNGWLNMIRDRLVLAKKLLTKEGIIFVSIDDSEQAYLKVLMDDIFGETNFLSCLIFDKGNAQNDAKNFEKNHEYVITFQKSPSFKISRNLEINSKKGQFTQLTIGGKDGPLIKRRNLGWTLYFNEKTGEKIPLMDYDPSLVVDGYNWKNIYKDDLNLISKGFTPIRPPIKKGIIERWTWDIEKAKNEIHRIIPRRNQKGWSLYICDERDQKFSSHKSILKFSSGSRELNSLNLSFPNPKNTDFIKELIKKHPNKNATVLDFFAGSGTTAHATLKLNKEDDGKRNFILCTNNENNIGLDITYERLHRIIKGKSTKNDESFDWIEKHTPFSNEKLRVFNIKHFDVETDQSKNLLEIKKMAVKNLKKLNPLYDDEDNIKVYYDLDGLNPLNESQKNQVYSTDIIHHQISQNIKNQNKYYCKCGKSFVESSDLEKHINKV